MDDPQILSWLSYVTPFCVYECTIINANRKINIITLARPQLDLVTFS